MASGSFYHGGSGGEGVGSLHIFLVSASKLFYCVPPVYFGGTSFTIIFFFNINLSLTSKPGLSIVRHFLDGLLWLGKPLGDFS